METERKVILQLRKEGYTDREILSISGRIKLDRNLVQEELHSPDNYKDANRRWKSSIYLD